MRKTENILFNRGFTLLEILIAIVISGLLFVGIMKYYRIATQSYSDQEQLSEMNLNAQYVLKELSDVLMQAGAACVATSNATTDMDTIIKITGSGPVYEEFTIKINPRGGFYYIPATLKLNTAAGCSLQVDDAKSFRYADKLARIPRAGSADSTIKIYNLVGIDTASNMIYLDGGSSTSETFSINDAVFSFVNSYYYLNGTDLCLNTDENVLAENIDSLMITFYNSDGDSVLTSSPPWKSIRSASIQVVAMTSKPNSNRRINLSYQFRLRNKVGGQP